MIKGIAAANGIVIGKAYLVETAQRELPNHSITPEQAGQELARIKRAQAAAEEQLINIKARLAAKAGSEEAAIFEAHLLLLADPAFWDAVAALVAQGKNGEVAVHTATEDFAAVFDAMEDEYMRARAADIRDIGQRWLNNLLGVETGSLGNMTEPAVVFAHDLTPSDTAQMDKALVLAFVTETGGRTSHSAIMARSLEIPAVVGAGDLEAVTAGDTVIVDGGAGLVLINPAPETIADYQGRQREVARRRQQLLALKDLPAVTTDGHEFELVANIGTPGDVASALAHGAQGIGLYRTEFLYMDRKDMPSEEEQYLAYRQVLEAFGQQPVIIRTLDIGGDKELAYLPMAKELNPFLGNRALRLCLANPQLFKTQLRALLRAGTVGNLWIMLPMVATIAEVRRAKEILQSAEAELAAAGTPFAKSYKLGIMVEIPAAAIQADHFAQVVDFFSIGTNDLIQYTCAADRMNENVSYLYDPFNPAVLRLIERVIDAGRSHGKMVGMCGEMAGEPLAAPLLVAMGMDEFSMSATSIPQVKAVIRSLSRQRCLELWDQAKQCEEGDQIRQLLEKELAPILK